MTDFMGRFFFCACGKEAMEMGKEQTERTGINNWYRDPSRQYWGRSLREGRRVSGQCKTYALIKSELILIRSKWWRAL